MNEIYVAFVWHQHQPYYKDVLTGRFVLPWVRLHGIRDYIGMALMLADFPRVKATVNMVPSLLAQIEDYARGRGEDELLSLTRLPPQQLDFDQKQFLVSNFFAANFQTMVAPHPRYRELYQKCQASSFSLRQQGAGLSDQELMDLQVWSSLAWFHPLVVGSDPLLSALVNKGREFTEEEKEKLLEKQQETLAEIIPLHRKLQDSGQIEVSTSAYYHPILPLLCDLAVARESNPGVHLPVGVNAHIEDARAQVQEAVETHQRFFGRAPEGFWPPEGSVSTHVIPILAEAGFRWFASDEEILAKSLGASFSRGSPESLRRLYRPYLVRQDGRQMQVVFRDHHLSDLIGFQYQRMTASEAAEDLLQRLRHIRKMESHRPALVCIILDGENPWEHYQNAGVDFLKELYRGLSETAGIITTTVAGYLEQFPAEEELPHLFPGSWINHNFDIWIGHQEDNRAWQYVQRTRDFLVRKEPSLGALPPEKRRQAWEQIYIAQGSDWFWWFGDEHSCLEDNVFDQLFRKHLENVYALVGETPPEFLKEPICQRREKLIYRRPSALLEVSVDGRPSNYFEWIGAGRYQCKQSRSTMARAIPRFIEEISFGFDPEHFFLRLDPGAQSFLEELRAGHLRLHFTKPRRQVVEVSDLGGKPDFRRRADGEVQPLPEAALAIGKIVELGLPFRALGISSGDQVSFYLVVEAGGFSQRVPREGAIDFSAPSPSFEAEVWRV